MRLHAAKPEEIEMTKDVIAYLIKYCAGRNYKPVTYIINGKKVTA